MTNKPADASTPKPVFIIPAEGRRVRKPDGSLLDQAGADVEWDSYWPRRELDGDVLRTKRPVEKKDA